MSFLKTIFRLKATKAGLTPSASSSTIASFCCAGSSSSRSLASLCDAPAKEAMVDIGMLSDLNSVRAAEAEEAVRWAAKISPIESPPIAPIGGVTVLVGRRRRVCAVVENKRSS